MYYSTPTTIEVGALPGEVVVLLIRGPSDDNNVYQSSNRNLGKTNYLLSLQILVFSKIMGFLFLLQLFFLPS